MRTMRKDAVVRIAFVALLAGELGVVSSQGIGINYSGGSPTDDAILDLDVSGGPKRGLLIPRVSLSSTTDNNFGNTPGFDPGSTSLLVYNLPGGAVPAGFYYWDGSQWVPFLTASNIGNHAWLLNGNSASSSNFIGTLNPVDFVVKTGGSGATNERMRFTSSGPITINTTTPQSGDVLTVFGSGLVGAINSLGAFAVNGYTGMGVGAGVYGYNASNGPGVFGHSGAPQGVGVFGLNMANDGDGVIGMDSSATGFAVYGLNKHSTGTGVVGAGNNVSTVWSLTNGSGGAFTSSNVGVFGKGTTSTSYGGYFEGGHSGNYSSNNVGVVGVCGNGTNLAYDFVGVYGWANTTNSWYGYGVVGEGNWYGVFAIGDIDASGIKWFLIDHPLDPENKYLRHACPESPEVLNFYRGVATWMRMARRRYNSPNTFQP